MTEQDGPVREAAKEAVERAGIKVFTKESLKRHDAEVKTATLLWHGVGLVLNAAAITWWRKRKAARRG